MLQVHESVSDTEKLWENIRDLAESYPLGKLRAAYRSKRRVVAKIIENEGGTDFIIPHNN